MVKALKIEQMKHSLPAGEDSVNESVESVSSGESQKKWEERSYFWVLKGLQVLRRENWQIALCDFFQSPQLALQIQSMKSHRSGEF